MFRKSTFFNDCFSKPQHVPPPPGKPSPLICARGRRGLGGFFSLFFQRPGPASPCRPRQGQGESRVRDEPTLPALPLPAAARKGRATQGPPAAPAVLGSPGAGLRGPEAWLSNSFKQIQNRFSHFEPLMQRHYVMQEIK